MPVFQVPAAVEQLPCDLKCDESLARAGREREQDARLTVGDGREHAFDGDILIIASLKVAALALEGYRGEAFAPVIRHGKGSVPEFHGAWKACEFSLAPCVHVDAVDTLTVARVGKTHRELCRVILGLCQAFG